MCKLQKIILTFENGQQWYSYMLNLGFLSEKISLYLKDMLHGSRCIILNIFGIKFSSKTAINILILNENINFTYSNIAD